MRELLPKLFLEFTEIETNGLSGKTIAREAGIQLTGDFGKTAQNSSEAWRRLFLTACMKLNMAPDVVEAAFGRFFFRFIRAQHGEIYNFRNSKDLVTNLPSVHSSCLDKHSEGGDDNSSPRFEVIPSESGDNTLIIEYESPNKLCRLLEALIRDIIRSYGDQAKIWHGPRCMKQGDSRCEIYIDYEELSDS